MFVSGPILSSPHRFRPKASVGLSGRAGTTLRRGDMANLRSSGSGRTQADHSRGPRPSRCVARLPQSVCRAHAARPSWLPCLASRRARAGLGMHGMDERLSRARESSARFEPHTWTRWGWGASFASLLLHRPFGFQDLPTCGGRPGAGHTCRRPTGDGAAHLRFLFLFTLPLARPAPSRHPSQTGSGAGMADRSFGPSRHPPPCVVFEVASLGCPEDLTSARPLRGRHVARRHSLAGGLRAQEPEPTRAGR